jgi:hypothetical protein
MPYRGGDDPAAGRHAAGLACRLPRAIAWVDGAAQDRANPRADHYNRSTTVYNREQNRREQFGPSAQQKTPDFPGF